jgi:hypothetical protein
LRESHNLRTRIARTKIDAVHHARETHSQLLKSTLATSFTEPKLTPFEKSRLGQQLHAWWRNNGAEAADWSVRIPVLAAGVAVLGLAGADPAYSTPIMGALVGGEKVIKALKRPAKKID